MVGDPRVLALESLLDVALPSRGQLGIGHFLIHVGGREFGLRSRDATLLACSFDEVTRRAQRRGSHSAPFARGAPASEIASAVRRALFLDAPEDERILGLTPKALTAAIHENHLLWAPDGDSAFDDGSYVLQFDEGNAARVIAFRASSQVPYDPASLREVILPSDSFYAALQRWAAEFAAEWLRTPKSPSSPPGRE